MTTAATRNIRQRLLEVRKQFRFLRKAKKVETYMAVTYDQLVGEIQELFIDNGISVEPFLIESRTIDTGAKSSKGNPLWRFEGVYDVAFVSVDDETDRLTIRVPAHANDYGDKAPGKATTYSVKGAILKVLLTETGENEEGRVGTEVSADRIVELQAAMSEAAAAGDKAKAAEVFKVAMSEARECQDNTAAKLFRKHAQALGEKAAEPANEFMPAEKPADQTGAVSAAAEEPAATPAASVAAAPAQPELGLTAGMLKTLEKAMERSGKTLAQYTSQFGCPPNQTPKSKINEAMSWARA